MAKIVYYRDDGTALPLNWETLDAYFIDDQLGTNQLAWEVFHNEVKTYLRNDLVEK